MKLLIFDTILDGHHSDYITHLIEYWQKLPAGDELCVVTPAGLAAQLPDEYLRDDQVKFFELTESDMVNVREASMIGRSFAGWNLYVEYAERIRPDHALLMYFDLYQMGLWLGRKSPCRLSGIYFRPSFLHYSTTAWKEKLVKIRKEFILARALSNPDFDTLFCLDKSAVPIVASMAKNVQVLPLSDPVKQYKLANDQVEAQKQALGVEKSRKVFLLFGHLDDRKGIEPVLDAVALLPQEASSRMTLILAGPINTEFRERLDEKIAALRTKAQIICHFEKLNETSIQPVFELSDFVLTLYRRHVGMSSIVVRAALSGKPVISSNYGYLGNLVSSQQLGITLDSESPVAIGQAFRQALLGEISFDQSAATRFAEQNTGLAFVEQILAGISGRA